MRTFRYLCIFVAALTVATPRAQESAAEAGRRKSFDTILDTYVRDGSWTTAR